MIGKIISGATFGPAINYIFNGNKADKENAKLTGIKKGIFLCTNQCFGTVAELTTQFLEVSSLNKRVTKPVRHMILSFAHTDKVTENEMIEIVHKLSFKMGFANHQFIAVHHEDKCHHHIHCISNTVSFEGKIYSDSHNYQKISELCREVEIEYNLQKVLSPRRFLPKIQRDLPRKDARIDNIKKIVSNALINSYNYDELRYQLMESKIDIDVGRGVTFIDQQKVRVKGSKIDLSKGKIDQYFLDKKQSNPHIKSRTYQTFESEIIDQFKKTHQSILSGRSYDIDFERPNDEIKIFKSQIGDAIKNTTTWDEFQIQLQLLGVTFKKGRGINFFNNVIQFKGSELGFSLAQIKSRFNMNKLDLEINKPLMNSVIGNEKLSIINSIPLVLSANQERIKRNEIMKTINKAIVEALNCSEDWEEFTSELLENEIIVYLEDDKIIFENNELRVKVAELELSSKLEIENLFEQSGNVTKRIKLNL